MASRLTLIRNTWKVIAERSNYKGTEMIAKSPVTGHYHFMEFSFNGNELCSPSEGYTRLAGLLNAMQSVEDLRQSFGKKKALQYFKEATKKK